MTLAISNEGSIRIWCQENDTLWKAQARNTAIKWGKVFQIKSKSKMEWYITTYEKYRGEKANITIGDEVEDNFDRLSLSTTY